MNSPAARTIAALLVTLGFLFLIAAILVATPDIWLGLFLVALLAPIVRMIGDALNPEVERLQTWGAHLWRLQELAIGLALQLVALAAAATRIALTLGLLYIALTACVALTGLALFALQAGLGLPVGRPIGVAEAYEALASLGNSLALAVPALLVMSLLSWAKDRLSGEGDT